MLMYCFSIVLTTLYNVKFINSIEFKNKADLKLHNNKVTTLKLINIIIVKLVKATS
jgi:hypothetical protein